jgi:hypothetical protein
MVRYYAQAVAYAKAYNVRNQWTAHAIARLAYFTQIVGDAKMATYVTATTDPTNKPNKMTYTNGQFLQTRAALPIPLPINGAAEPAPVLPKP